MLAYMEYLEIPTMVIIVFVAIFLVIQIIGELLEFKGKVVPEFCKIRKYFARRKQEREIIQQMPEALKEIKDMFNDFNSHYSKDNIMKRDKWIDNVDKRLDNVDKRIEGNDDLTKRLDSKIDTLLIESKRNEIIDFASRVGNESAPVTREYFDRIFKTYKEYEDLIEETGRTNGEVDISYKIIQESYESHTRNHTFVEDARGW